MTQKIEKLEKLLQKTIKHRHIFNIVLHVQTGDEGFEWSGAVSDGNAENNNYLRADSPYFIASITKIFTATTIMLLYEQK
ncbi:serine hydrolase, partial [bacterium]|nr:serine hydrolase [bacterium]